jgi:hypothetical protein
MPAEATANADPAETHHKVVVGVDGSDNAMRALEWRQPWPIVRAPF